ncbi:recombinase family protein [Arthrobacter sp. NPDC058288]|uniref:recombinase family protein n=1 Tax=Arthrobacter sp. NPDC058288 TaxID=3346424 RepID=UPI0036F125A5
MKAGIYARISQDADGTSLGVHRQVDDCTLEARRRGWDIVDRFVDNDVSATRSKHRPQYARMIDAVTGGEIDALIVWDVDRLTRTPRELEDIIDLADRYKLQLANVGGDIDLSTPQGRMTARIKGTVARHETDQQSRRLKRKFEEKALKGEPHGFTPYGFLRVRDESGATRDVRNPEQAPVVAEAATRFIDGESLRGICADFNARGIHGPRAEKWNTTVLRQILQRATNAGLRTHRGVVVGPANVEPIYDEDTHHQLKAMFDDPTRKNSYVGNTPVHLLTSIAICGLCGSTMRRLRGIVNGTGKQQPPAYGCKSCFKIRRKQSLVDAVVTEHVLARLEQPDALAAIAAGDPGRVKAAEDQARALEARLATASDQFADGIIDGTQLARISAKLRPQIDEARQVVTRALPHSSLAAFTGPGAAQRWAAAPLEQQRAVIQALMTVTILPAGIGKGRDESLIRVEWKTGN